MPIDEERRWVSGVFRGTTRRVLDPTNQTKYKTQRYDGATQNRLRHKSIDREFVTSAKKSRILTNFPKLKKFVKIRTKIR